MKHSAPLRLSDYCIDRSSGRIVRARTMPSAPPTRATMAEFLTSSVSDRKRSYLRALEKAALEQAEVIELAEKVRPK